jgi:hypothetical protein
MWAQVEDQKRETIIVVTGIAGIGVLCVPLRGGQTNHWWLLIESVSVCLALATLGSDEVNGIRLDVLARSIGGPTAAFLLVAREQDSLVDQDRAIILWGRRGGSVRVREGQ